jgi:two-component system chemotaxis sensor kinase CheA
LTAIRQRLLDVFEIEYQEHLAAVRAILAKAEVVRGDLTEATRRAHSLKGAARAVGLDDVESLAHTLEALFIRVEHGEAELDRDLRRHVADSLDEIEDRVVTSRQPGTSRALPAASAADPAVPTPPTGDSGARSATPGNSRPTSVRIEATNLDRLLTSAGELHSDMLCQRAGSQHVRALAQQMQRLERQWQGLWKQIEGTLRRESGQAGRARLIEAGDRVVNDIKLMSRQAAAVADAQDQCTRHLRRHLGELEGRVKAARMVPTDSAFGAFRKMVRDVAASEGKQVEVVIDGLDSEADRLVLQRIKDPVMHMLRNAVSHGIEHPADREAKRKSPTGHVALRVSSERDRLTIVVEDDGRGIDPRRIGDKAVALGLMSRAEADTASGETLNRLLLEPGFSTADTVTKISGRGVGLSVAREAVSSLQGALAIRSEPGRGTRIEISLPVSILTRRLLLVRFRQQSYALPADAVVKAIRIKVTDVIVADGRPTVRHNGAPLPLLSIGAVLTGDADVTADKEHACVAVLRSGGGDIGVVVEEFVGVNEFVVRMLDFGGRQRPWSGIVTTEDGSPCLVLDADAFAGGNDHAAIVFRARQKQADASKVVLVVDDSITTRTLEKSILEANGYKVRLSVDGRDAIAQLRADPADIVVSDIEMPHLNGFELVRSMKEDKALATIPVVLVTSRDDPADRERGLVLGADAYVIKQRFDQHELLRTIRQII